MINIQQKKYNTDSDNNTSDDDYKYISINKKTYNMTPKMSIHKLYLK